MYYRIRFIVAPLQNIATLSHRTATVSMSSMPSPPPVLEAGAAYSSRRVDDTSDANLGVIKTNDEASGAKACCASLGYFVDPFISHFVRRVPKHPPLINRGYHARVATVRAVIDAFLDARFEVDSVGGDGRVGVPDDRSASNRGVTRKRQIVSLGAGYDTTFFRIRRRYDRAASTETETETERSSRSLSLTFVEVDHASVVLQKARVINETKTLAEMCEGGGGVKPFPTREENEPFLKQKNTNASVAFADDGGYYLIGHDLRDINTLDLCAFARVDPNAPTLFLSECCLAYLEPSRASEVLRWALRFGRSFGNEKETRSQSSLRAYFAYDPTVLRSVSTGEDPFGTQMVAHLKTKGCPLLSSEGPDALIGVEAHAIRKRETGWSYASGSCDMLEALETLRAENPAEQIRVDRLEPLDEFEEYFLIQRHYAVSWGVSGGVGVGEKDLRTMERAVKRSRRAERGEDA